MICYNFCIKSLNNLYILHIIRYIFQSSTIQFELYIYYTRLPLLWEIPPCFVPMCLLGHRAETIYTLTPGYELRHCRHPSSIMVYRSSSTSSPIDVSQYSKENHNIGRKRTYLKKKSIMMIVRCLEAIYTLISFFTTGFGVMKPISEPSVARHNVEHSKHSSFHLCTSSESSSVWSSDRK